jgi:hypothetical protein
MIDTEIRREGNRHAEILYIPNRGYSQTYTIMLTRYGRKVQSTRKAYAPTLSAARRLAQEFCHAG